MALDQDREFVDDGYEAEARQQARRISIIGILAALIVGLGLVALLIYGRILSDDAAVVSAPSAAVVPTVPTPGSH